MFRFTMPPCIYLCACMYVRAYLCVVYVGIDRVVGLAHENTAEKTFRKSLCVPVVVLRSLSKVLNSFPAPLWIHRF